MALPQWMRRRGATVAGRRGRCRELVPDPPIQTGMDRQWQVAHACPRPLFFHASKNERCAVSGQNTLNIAHLPAFELLDMCGDYLGTALFGFWSGRPDHSHLDWRAIRLELEFILPPFFISGDTRDAGHLLHRELSNLPARSSRRLD